MDATTVARWRDWSGDGIQHLVLREGPTAIVAEAVVIAVDAGEPFAARFRIVCDPAWRTRRVEAAVVGGERRLVLAADGQGAWSDGDGRPLPELAGAIDVDLSVTPFTNTLPIRRLGLAAGESAELRVVYLRLPDLTVEVDGQRYTCLEPMRRYRYEALAGGFAREIEVDVAGFVVTYPGLFRRLR